MSTYETRPANKASTFKRPSLSVKCEPQEVEYQLSKTETDHSFLPYLPPMASAAAPQILLHKPILRNESARMLRATRTANIISLKVHASQSQGPGSGRPQSQRAPPGVDSRIHWDNEDEGWIGGTNSYSAKQQQPNPTAEDIPKNLLADNNFADLLTTSSDSHYQ